MSEMPERRDLADLAESGVRESVVPALPAAAENPAGLVGRLAGTLIDPEETAPVFEELAASERFAHLAKDSLHWDAEATREPEPWGFGPTPLSMMLTELMGRVPASVLEAVEAEVQGGPAVQVASDREAETVMQVPVRPAKDATVQFSVVNVGTGN